MLASGAKKILVLGVGRSGTSSLYALLQRILEDQFPNQTDYVYEPFLWDRETFNKSYFEISTEFREIPSVSVDGIYHHKKIPLFCDASSEVPPGSQEWLTGLFESPENKPHTLAKMIRANGRVGLIKKLVPDLKIIAIFRNPLEVINSSLNMFSFFGDDFYRSDYPRFLAETCSPNRPEPGRFKKTAEVVEREMQYWAAMNQALARETGVDRAEILPVLHEQYLADRENTVRQICRHVELDFHGSYVNDAERTVGPEQRNENHLSVGQYLFLEGKLDEYRALANRISPFNLDTPLRKIRERFITSGFAAATEIQIEHYNSLYANRQYQNQEKTVTALKERVANADAQRLALQEKIQTIRQKDDQLALAELKIQNAERELARRDSVIRNKEEEIVRKEAAIFQEAKDRSANLGELQAVRAELAQQQALVQKQLQELARRDAQLVNLEAANANKDATILQNGQEISRLKTGLKAAACETTRLSSILAEKEIGLKRLESANEAWQSKLATADAQVESLRHTIRQNEEEILKQERDLAIARENVNEHRRELNHQAKELARSESVIANQQIEINDHLQACEQSNRQLEKLTAELEAREQDFRQQQLASGDEADSLKKEIFVQLDRLSGLNGLLDDLRKVNSYPLSQIDRKLRAFRGLIKTYDQVKPQWHDKKHPGYTAKHLRRLKQTVQDRGVDLGNQMEAFYGNHRSGWSYAVSSLASINKPDGIYLDTFVERTFCWSPEGVRPHTRPWIGFIHVPPFVPSWFQYQQSNNAIFATEAWQQSLPWCRGLFTLSKYHRDFLRPKVDFPVESLIHPTEFPERLWSWSAFEKNRRRRIVQLGWWLRKLHAIYQLPGTSYQKTLIRTSETKYLADLFAKEKDLLTATGELSGEMFDTVEVLGYLPNPEYDALLASNIVFLNLYDSSANNSVIECIARGTPLLVNRIPPVVEYLGEDYPFYYDSMSEAAEKAMDLDLVYRAHKHLLGCITRKKLTGEYFKNSILESNLLLDAYQDNQDFARRAA